MPNVKLYVDRITPAGRVAALEAALPALRDLICRDLQVTPDACQIALVPVTGLPDQPPVNAEFHIMPGPHRTPELLQAFAERVRDLAGQAAGQTVAVRITLLDPAGYLALK